MSTNKQNSLTWSFDISSYRLLGRELITDKITAMFELVKNSYDANATEVNISFIYDKDDNDNNICTSIIIEDDGIGMSESDIRKKWMVIGSSDKRQNRTSPAPFHRKLVGKKGIGRFAIDKLGGYVHLVSKKQHSAYTENVIIDWKKYEAEEKRQLTLFDESEVRPLFTEIENRYWREKVNTLNDKGTTLAIKDVRESWDKFDIELLIQELGKLASPLSEVSNHFLMKISASPFGYDKVKIENKAIRFATHKFEISFNQEKELQEYLVFDEFTNRLKIEEKSYPIFGPVKMVIYYFDRLAKARFKKNTINQNIDGVRIYRDGLITTPFAEVASESNQRKDLLGLDKRRWSGFFDKISNRDIIGYIEISDEKNPGIIESTNRQSFLDSREFSSLKEFFIEQISVIENYLGSIKEKRREETGGDLKMAREEIEQVNSMLKNLQRVVPKEAKKDVQNIYANVRKVESSIKRGIAEYQELNLEKTRQENLFFSLMSLQEYAGEIAHMVRTSIAKISRYANFFYEEYPNPEYSNLYSKYANSIYKELMSLNNALDFMLSYSKSNLTFQSINIKVLITDLVEIVYADSLENKGIEVKVDIGDNIEIFHNKKFFEDIFQNLIDNSIKALEMTTNKQKKIIIKSESDDDKLILYFIDNGIGIDDKIKSRIFNVFFTTTGEQGGGGIGLFSVKKRIQAMNGSIEVVPNEYFRQGATFKIILPFNKSL